MWTNEKIEKRCFLCQTSFLNSEYSCLFEDWNFCFEIQGYVCSFCIYHFYTNKISLCKLTNDSFMAFGLKHSNKIIFDANVMTQKIDSELFKNNFSILDYKYKNNRSVGLNTLEYKAFVDIIKIQTAFGEGRRPSPCFTATIKNIAKTRTITDDTPINRQVEKKKDWFVTEECTDNPVIDFQYDNIHLFGPVSFQYTAHGINRPLPVFQD
jgi:hypothetical protein